MISNQLALVNLRPVLLVYIKNQALLPENLVFIFLPAMPRLLKQLTPGKSPGVLHIPDILGM